MMSDDAIGMFAGFIDSSGLGFYDPALNKGFNRRDSGMPTTDVSRMVTFFLEEFDRRILREEDMADKPPVGGPLIDQMNYELPDCEAGEGVDETGQLTWLGDDPARYVYILEEGSSNPGVPPNYDLPEGTIWRVDVAPQDSPLDSGITLGDVPQGGFQVYPEVGIAPESLVPGERYHLYVLFDVAMPVARCVFEAP
ncbi:uncharacterized protein METZ01_LOCUS512279 [marine metagenome]|uniref:Uncharacterized protein n=1 Tax=marine metagenome TaxID=408172 RepID=A0A383ET78_9ZZZZ